MNKTITPLLKNIHSQTLCKMHRSDMDWCCGVQNISTINKALAPVGKPSFLSRHPPSPLFSLPRASAPNGPWLAETTPVLSSPATEVMNGPWFCIGIRDSLLSA